MDYSIEELINKGEFKCNCGRNHSAHLKKAFIYNNAIEKLSACVKELGGTKAYIVADLNTISAAGEKVLEHLKSNNIDFVKYIYNCRHFEPDDAAIGSAFLNFDYSCDIIIAIGSGVINDICKILSKSMKLPFIIVATAASMDGYASSTSSVIRSGLKVSVISRCPDIIIGDLDILCDAPKHMTASGLGDMLAKYISICEWRIGNIVNGEYYCEEIAKIIRCALKKCVNGACGIQTSDPESVKAVMEGMVISGIAADYAQVSRPVSGVEHYFSHIWDMRYIEFNTAIDLHGIQCGIGTLLAIKGYDMLKSTFPDKDRANSYFYNFDKKKWIDNFENFIGKAGIQMKSNALISDIYNSNKHEIRLNNIINNWDKILKIIKEEIPAYDYVKNVLIIAGAPCLPSEIGIDKNIISKTFKTTKDIRDKYILSTLMFDIGIIDEIDKIY